MQHLRNAKAHYTFMTCCVYSLENIYMGERKRMEGDFLLMCCRFDLGTADELGLDVLINTLTCFSKE